MPTVVAEKTPIESLEVRLEDLISRYERGCEENARFRAETASLKQELEKASREAREQREELVALRGEVSELRKENASFRSETARLREERDLVKVRINKLIGQVDERLQQLI